MNLTFLTPRLPPAVCGLGDHTVQLARAMREQVAKVTVIDVFGDEASANSAFDQVDRWNRKPVTLRGLLKHHDTDCLWVQYSGYGYGYQGIPWYLVRALNSVSSTPNIAVFFHETHCDPRQLGWKSNILSSLQRRIGKAIANLANTVFTTNEVYRHSIHREYSIPSEQIVVLPLGSNIVIPEIDELKRKLWRRELGWGDDELVAIAFGSTNGQRRALLRNRDWLRSALLEGLISRIVSVGGNSTTSRAEVLYGIDGEIVKASSVLGYRTEAELAKLLIAADIGLVGYPYERFGKSGVFMAYSYAGLPVIAMDEPQPNSDEFQGGLLVRSHELEHLHSIAFDIEARISRQQLASSRYAWSSIARTALDAIAVCDRPVSSSLVSGSTRVSN